MLGMCDEWRGRRELARLQRLCFAAGLGLTNPGADEVVWTLSKADPWRYNARRVKDGKRPGGRDGSSALYLLSADVAEMVAAHLDRDPPTAAVHTRWQVHQVQREEAVMRNRAEVWLLLACGWAWGLSLFGQLLLPSTLRGNAEGEELSVRGLMSIAGSCCVLVGLQHCWREATTWLRPAHALSHCVSAKPAPAVLDSKHGSSRTRAGSTYRAGPEENAGMDGAGHRRDIAWHRHCNLGALARGRLVERGEQ